MQYVGICQNSVQVQHAIFLLFRQAVPLLALLTSILTSEIYQVSHLVRQMGLFHTSVW